MTAEPRLSLLEFGRFYAPLATTSLLLTATNPIVAAALARSPTPQAALAGYSVAFALAGVLYSPLLVFQQVAATRLIDRGAARPLWLLALIFGAVFSALAATVAFTPLGDWVLSGLVGVTGQVLDEARAAMALLWAVPLLTAIRAYHQGRLVGGHRTQPIAAATGLRTGVLAVVAFALTGAAGALAGAAAFTAGLLVETLVVGLARRVEAAPTDPAPADVRVPKRRLLRFSGPLMLNVLLWWFTPLLIQSVLARTPAPEATLAAFAVVEAVAWFVAAPVGQLQHASIALVSTPRLHRVVRLWALGIAVVTALAVGVLALPPVRDLVVGSAFRLDAQLTGGVGRALPLAALYPLLYGHRQYYQGLFIGAGRPGIVGWGAIVRVLALLAAALTLLGVLGGEGAAFGVGLAVWGLAVEGVFLERLSHRIAIPALRTGLVAATWVRRSSSVSSAGNPS